FSSRRRHTRFSRDWSSDVCSSDLSAAKLVLHPAMVALAAWALAVDPIAAGVMVAAAALPVAGNVYILAHHFQLAEQRVSAAILRSEERRVGKECRYRGGQ